MADVPHDPSAREDPASRAIDEEEWVPPGRAAQLVGCSEEWLMDRCRDGRLPRRPARGTDADFVVPISTARALAAREITE